jgi:hypothetical protein
MPLNDEQAKALILQISRLAKAVEKQTETLIALHDDYHAELTAELTELTARATLHRVATPSFPLHR